MKEMANEPMTNDFESQHNQFSHFLYFQVCNGNVILFDGVLNLLNSCYFYLISYFFPLDTIVIYNKLVLVKKKTTWILQQF